MARKTRKSRKHPEQGVNPAPVQRRHRVAGPADGKKIAKRKAHHKHRVLIAEDDLPFRDSLQALFESEGFSVRSVGNVEDIYELVAAQSFDVVILDMHMPDRKSGRIEEDAGLAAIPAVLRKYAKFGERTVLVVFTGYPSVQDCFAVTDAGAYYLPKCVLDINKDMVDMSAELVQGCKTLLDKRYYKNIPRPWLEAHYEYISRQYRGQAVAIFARNVEVGNLPTETVGEFKILSAPTVEQLKGTILRNACLRTAMPLVLEIKKEDD